MALESIKDLLPEMAEYPQWIGYTLTDIKENGKGTKIPKYLDGNLLKNAKTNDPATWMAFNQAYEMVKKFNLAGLGFIFSDKDPFVGIDLDLCRDPKTGQIEQWAKDIIFYLNSYTEITPSGKGFHILCKGTIERSLKRDPIEIYNNLRFFTITGHVLGEDLTDIEERSTKINELITFISEKEQKHNEHQRHTQSKQLDSAPQDNYEKAELALNNLSSWRCDEHDSWLAVGMSLRELGQSGFYLWDNWSRQSSKYNQRECEKRWRSFYNGGNSSGTITLSSLFYWAKQDSPGFRTTNLKSTKLNNSSANQNSEKKYSTQPLDPTIAENNKAEALALTDMGNAQRLVRAYGESIKYCFVWKKWLVYDGKKWTADDLGVVAQYAEKTVKNIFLEAAEADFEESTQIAKWAIKSQSNERIKALLERAKNQEGIPIMPEQFDTNPWLLNCTNGTINLQGGQLQPHQQSDYLTKSTTTYFDPEATCPTWLKFLTRIMNDNQNLVGFLQRAIGYSLTGNTMEKALFFLYGAMGDNGKSTFLETLTALLGSYALAKFPVNALIDDPKSNNNSSANVAQLAGVRFVSCSEMGKGKKLNEELVKDLTGGIDSISAKRLYENPFTFRPSHKLFIYGNDKPLVNQSDNALWKRLKLIPFLVSIPEAEQDKKLPEKLLLELPGILAWAVQGCLDWQKNGLGVPDEVIQAVNDYRHEMDALAGFIESCCLVGEEYRSSAKDLFAAYGRWCDENGEKSYTQTFVGRQLSSKGFERYKGTGGYYWWRGIGLVDG